MSVAVVGGGLSGLVAARELARRGIEVTVLEAADRLGGRVLSETSALGSRLDLGGQWIGAGHHRLAALGTELGATAFQMHTPSQPTVVDGAKRLSPANPAVLGGIVALAGVEILSRTGTPTRWNNATLDGWIRRVPGDTTRRLLQVLLAVSTTADFDRLSVQALAEMVRHEGGLMSMVSTRGGAQDSLFVQGAGHLIEALGNELGSRVRLNAQVTAIRRDADGVVIESSAGTVGASKVVVAVPPPMCARISFSPGLPPERIALQRNTYMGSVYKAIAVFETPFWSARSGGEFLVLDKPGIGVFDTTAPGGPGHLCLLVGGTAARELDSMTPEQRRAAVLGPLVAHIGSDVLRPASWHEKSWHLDEFAGGGYLALPVPGTREGFLPNPSDPVGDVHWAGTETAAEHAGYLEGAIEAGARAADEVAALLRIRG